ncbi:MAG: carbon-nitrogen hydrolase family protein [Candidatus Omnitrophota bacterium]
MREVRISIINTRRGVIVQDDATVISRVKERIARAGRDKADLILLPEVFGNSLVEKWTTAELARISQTVPGPIFEELAPLARKYRTYIAFGLFRRSGKTLYNSLLLLNRQGKHVWTFDKITPTLYEMNAGVKPGREFNSYLCDFGRIGGAICFDINFLELAEIYLKQATELILFSSVFPGGRLLDVWAVRYGFNVAASTWYDYNRIIDCAGRTVGQTSDFLPTATYTLNLNRRLVHMDKNLERIEAMQKKYPGDVLLEDLRLEAFCIITSLRKGLEVSELIREFKIITLYQYFERSRKVRAKMGGMSYTIKT